MATADNPQLYLITPSACELAFYQNSVGPILETLEVSCLRLGLQTADEDQLKRHADELRELAHPLDIPVLMTDHHRLAIEMGFDGVHRTDGLKNLRDIRDEIGSDAILGTYCATSRHDGMTAGEIGADYVSFGPVAPSNLADDHAEKELFEWWSEMIEVPVVAEGQLTPELVGDLSSAVDFIAIGAEIWGKDDKPLAALNQLLSAWNG